MLRDISQEPVPGYRLVHVSPRLLDILALLPEYGKVTLTVAGGYIDKDFEMLVQYRSVETRGDRAGEPPRIMRR